MNSQNKNKIFSNENIIVAIMFVAAGLVFASRFGIASAFPFIGPELQLNNLQLGLTMSVTAVCWAISSLVFSSISDFLGKRKLLLVICVFTFSISTGLIGFASSFVMLIIVRAIMGIFEGPVIPLMQASVEKISTPKRRGLNLGIVIAGTSLLGVSLQPIYVTAVSTAYGWREAFKWLAIPGLVVALLIIIFLKEKRVLQHKAEEEKAVKEKITGSDIKQLFVNRNFILAIIGTLASIAWTLTISTFSQVFMVNGGGLPAGKAAIILSVSGLLQFVSNIVMPAVSDRIGRKPVYTACTLGMIIAPVFMILFSHSFNLLFVYAAFGILVGAPMTMITYVITGESVPRKLTATAFAILLCLGELFGGALGPSVGGVLADKYSLNAPILLCSALGAVSLIVALLLKETLPYKTKQQTIIDSVVQ